MINDKVDDMSITTSSRTVCVDKKLMIIATPNEYNQWQINHTDKRQGRQYDDCHNVVAKRNLTPFAMQYYIQTNGKATLITTDNAVVRIISTAISTTINFLVHVM